MAAQQLQVTKVTGGGRISLGQKAMEVLNVELGDNVQIVEDNGLVYISKIRPEAALTMNEAIE